MNLRLLKRARAVVAVSKHTREQLLRHCPFLDPQRVVAIHNGLQLRWRAITDASRLEEFRTVHGFKMEKFILHVGSDSWYKNFSALLRGFAEIEDKSIALVKAGRISSEERQLIASLGIEARVKQFTELSDEQLVVLYNCAEAVVFPSLHEGFGWPPLEAMACGCPVIAGDRPSLPEICGEAALYVDPEKPSEIAAAIARLRSEPGLRSDLKRKGFEQAAKYDWQQTAQSILALFNS
jgi:glycosyltransferase involved in cell wall biosynthesis